MAELSIEDRERIWRGLMRYWSNLWETVVGCDKADLLAAINATDTWIEDNQGAYNTALPNPFKTNATTTQKTLLFCAVAAMRVSPAFARMLFGEVD